VELLLNFLWLSVSLAMVLTWAWTTRHESTKRSWNVFIALVLLLVLLLPVISMTDDLVAMDGPSESEHVVRRSEMPLLHLTHDTAALLDIGLLSALLFLGFAVLFSRLSRFMLRFSPRILMEAFIRTTGVRPPPLVSLTA